MSTIGALNKPLWQILKIKNIQIAIEPLFAPPKTARINIIGQASRDEDGRSRYLLEAIRVGDRLRECG